MGTELADVARYDVGPEAAAGQTRERERAVEQPAQRVAGGTRGREQVVLSPGQARLAQQVDRSQYRLRGIAHFVADHSCRAPKALFRATDSPT